MKKSFEKDEHQKCILRPLKGTRVARHFLDTITGQE
jgi:hypothetical protein